MHFTIVSQLFDSPLIALSLTTKISCDLLKLKAFIICIYTTLSIIRQMFCYCLKSNRIIICIYIHIFIKHGINSYSSLPSKDSFETDLVAPSVNETKQCLLCTILKPRCTESFTNRCIKKTFVLLVLNI